MSSRIALAFVSVVVVAGCARGGFVEDTSGAGGATTMSSTSGSGMTTSSSASTSGASTSGASTSAATTGSTSASSSNAASSSSSGLMCDSDEHICNATCAGNTIETGCFLSASCNPCPAPPAMGMEICNANGQCDFTCPMGYNKVGSACACATQCCTQADCSGNQTCSGGTCMNLCDDDDCQTQCIAMCFIQMKFGVGQCNGGNCNCVCI